MNNDAKDDQGTTAEQARTMLENLCESGFDSDAGKLALVLGRDVDEINDLLSGTEEVDDDLLMKIRGIAQERNIEIE